MSTVAVDIEGLVALATAMRKRIERAIEALRDPDRDDTERVEATLEILQD